MFTQDIVQACSVVLYNTGERYIVEQSKLLGSIPHARAIENVPSIAWPCPIVEVAGVRCIMASVRLIAA
jgi:hypothetical protein